MISRIKGTLLSRDLERVEVETPGGLVYEVEIPLSVMSRLPPAGGPIELRTCYVVREDSATLYGFLESHEREMFTRLLMASGVGPKLALAMLSALPARRLARALAEKDMAALRQVSGVGKKTAERIALELADRVLDLAVGPEGGPITVPGAQEAVSGLVALGYSWSDADRAVRRALEEGPAESGEELIRRALATR